MSADGSRIGFADSELLTAQSPFEGSDVCEYNVNTPEGSKAIDLTVDGNPGEPVDLCCYKLASEHLAFIVQLGKTDGIAGGNSASPDGRLYYFNATELGGVPGGGICLGLSRHSVQLFRYDAGNTWSSAFRVRHRSRHRSIPKPSWGPTLGR